MRWNQRTSLILAVVCCCAGGDVSAEETGGAIKFMVKDKADVPAQQVPAQQVIVKIPVLGAYSKTWPLNCPKSEKIVRGFADYPAKPGSNRGFGGIGMLFLLSTGEEKDLQAVRQWARGLAGRAAPTYAWHLGYGGIPLTEYYLRTGDRFLYDGKFVAKAKLLGTWTIIDQVQAVDEFNTEKEMAPGRPLFTKMTVKTIDGTDYLFVEAGGFSTRNPAGWQSPLYVMKRAGR